MELIIENLSKRFAQTWALQDVSLRLEAGMVGLVGPNGAGKTSLIRIINQITAPDSGEVYFNGQKLNQSHINRIGYLPEERGLYKKMEIGEQMIYLARLKGLSRDEAQKRLKFWFEKLGMETWWKKKIEELSKGMQQKAQFVATVLHEPELIILDEPFNELDEASEIALLTHFRQQAQNGKMVILITHNKQSLSFCNKIVSLDGSTI